MAGAYLTSMTTVWQEPGRSGKAWQRFGSIWEAGELGWAGWGWELGAGAESWDRAGWDWELELGWDWELGLGAGSWEVGAGCSEN